MIKIMRAVAAVMLLATGAQAATVDGAWDSVTFEKTNSPVGGKSYYFTVTPGSLAAVPSQYLSGPGAYSEMTLTLSGQGITSAPLTSIGFGNVSSYPFTFQWAWKDTGPQTLTFQGTLKLYSNASPDYGNMPGTGDSPPPLVGLQFPNGVPVFHQIDIGPITWLSAKAAVPDTNAVPIGGTLPLMLSALGLGALVLRRQAQRAAA